MFRPVETLSPLVDTLMHLSTKVLLELSSAHIIPYFCLIKLVAIHATKEHKISSLDS
jgi:hypothetical protein